MDIQIQFILQNVHFALNLFVAFVFFAALWLFFDAWTNQKDKKNALKWMGFLLLSLSFLAHATQVEQITLVNQLTLASLFSNLALAFRISGYVVLALGLLMDPLQKKPTYGENNTVNVALMTSPLGGFMNILSFF